MFEGCKLLVAELPVEVLLAGNLAYEKLLRSLEVECGFDTLERRSFKVDNDLLVVAVEALKMLLGLLYSMPGAREDSIVGEFLLCFVWYLSIELPISADDRFVGNDAVLELISDCDNNEL